MMKSVFTLLAVTALFTTSCSKDEVIEVSQLTEGYWGECYDNPNFSMDSSVKYKFELDGTYTLNGTASGWTSFHLNTIYFENGKKYKMIGCVGGSGDTYYLSYDKSPSYSNVILRS